MNKLEIEATIYQNIRPCPYCGRRKFIVFERGTSKPIGRYFCEKCRTKADFLTDDVKKLTVNLSYSKGNRYVNLIKKCKKKWNEQLTAKQWKDVKIEDHCSNCPKWKEHLILSEQMKIWGIVRKSPCVDCEWEEFREINNEKAL